MIWIPGNAAAEVERLRAALTEILRLYDTDTDNDTYATLAMIAREAQKAIGASQQTTDGKE